MHYLRVIWWIGLKHLNVVPLMTLKCSSPRNRMSWSNATLRSNGTITEISCMSEVFRRLFMPQNCIYSISLCFCEFHMLRETWLETYLYERCCTRIFERHPCLVIQLQIIKRTAYWNMMVWFTCIAHYEKVDRVYSSDGQISKTKFNPLFLIHTMWGE